MHNRYLVQFNIPDGIQFVIETKRSTSGTYKLLKRYHDGGCEFRCWSCGIDANAIFVREMFCKKSGAVEREELVVAHINEKGDIEQFTRDHIVPAAFRGPDEWRNYRPSCAYCNNRRQTKMTEEEVLFAKKEFGLFEGMDLKHIKSEVHVVPFHNYRGKAPNFVVQINLPWQDVYSKIIDYAVTT